MLPHDYGLQRTASINGTPGVVDKARFKYTNKRAANASGGLKKNNKNSEMRFKNWKKGEKQTI